MPCALERYWGVFSGLDRSLKVTAPIRLRGGGHCGATFRVEAVLGEVAGLIEALIAGDQAGDRGN